MAKLDGVDEKLDKSIEENCKRICDCEIKIKEHSEKFADIKGKASIVGAIAGFLAGVGQAILVWLVTNK